tara:strand:- start:1381 stop:1500 length:120 start_codon:yes stop_codon:yes gene_type:complete
MDALQGLGEEEEDPETIKILLIGGLIPNRVHFTNSIMQL